MLTQFDILCQEPRLYFAWKMVKAKGSTGGIDGISIDAFDRERGRLIPQLAESLRNGTWKPQPYEEVEVAKVNKPDEMRKLGMTAITDKIVQCAIKSIIEPRLERIFLSNSYGYRPGKGVTKAIRRTLAECHKAQYHWVLRLDIDNFFDSIDHDILRKRLLASGTDPEIVRLIMLCVQMGKVKRRDYTWVDSYEGTPQGAILSPLLSNLYLHSFDQFAASRGVPYIRYADDFLFLSETEAQAKDLLERTEAHLKEKLKLSLNQPPLIAPLAEGFDFLGITIRGGECLVSDRRRTELLNQIDQLQVCANGLTPKSQRVWDGFGNYYAKLLPQTDLEEFDATLKQHLSDIIRDASDTFGSKTALRYALGQIVFLSKGYQKNHKLIIEELISEFIALKAESKQDDDNKRNKKLIQQRKQEYRRLEAETSGLLVNKPGTFIGLSSRGITVSQKGKTISTHHKGNLSQIIITGKGVSLSSNLIEHCLSNRIPIDFFNHHGAHLGSIITARSIQNSLWLRQSNADDNLRNNLAMGIITGKIKNQHGLVKYFHKYHKNHYPNLQEKKDAMDEYIETFKKWQKEAYPSSEDFMKKLIGHEAQVAIRYWDYIRELLSDDEVGFEHREHRGATDLMNSMLNYGYAILYVRMWQALLAAHLNPFESLIHVRQDGKPTLVYDMVEIFRSQVVDRVVITLIQKGHELEIRNGLLSDTTRGMLVKSIMERLARYEKFQGEEMKMEQIIHRQALQLAQAFEDKGKFKPYVAKW